MDKYLDGKVRRHRELAAKGEFIESSQEKVRLCLSPQIPKHDNGGGQRRRRRVAHLQFSLNTLLCKCGQNHRKSLE